MFDLFSLENDSELDQIDVVNSGIINDETAIDAAAEKKEPVEVSITESQAAHNEAASAGGCVVGDNEEQLTMDPVAAEESYIRKQFGLSSEDLEEAVDETIAEGAAVPNAEVVEGADVAGDDDLEATAVPAETTVNISSPEEAHVDVNLSPDADVTVEKKEEEEPTEAEVATLEGLRQLWSREDAIDGGAEATSDVEFDVKTPQNDVNIELEGKAVTIEPNEGSDVGAAPEEPPAPPAEDTTAPEEPPAEGSEAEPQNPETGNESFYWL